jgi:cyclohexadienyl dehydratase
MGRQKRRKSRRLENGPRAVKRSRRGRWIRTVAALAGLVLATTAATADPPLRVGTSGDYAPFSRAAAPGAPPKGLDVALLRAWARERGRELAFVSFRWPELVSDLEAGRFDMAASGITVRPERSAAGRFTVAVAETEAYALARRGGGDPPTPAALDRPQIKIAVNAGGHLERVARAAFPHAAVVAVPDNDAVVDQLAEGRVDAVVTDAAEAPHWEARAGVPLARVGPLSRDRKAWLVRAEQADLAADLDAWLLAREADGSLAKWRAEWLGADTAATAGPLRALLAAIDERLALMPLVGAAKRRDGVPLVVPEREQLVLERALADVRAQAQRIGRKPPPEARVRALFTAQLEAARRVQQRAAGAPAPDAVPDLEHALRPALLRIGERITRLVLALPEKLDAAAVRSAARDALRAPYLDDGDRDAIADAVTGLAQSA